MPWDFYRLVPREFTEMVQGHLKRKRARLRQEAGWVCVLANSSGHMKRTLRVEDLIGLEPEEMAKIKIEVARKRRRKAAEQAEQKA